MFLSSWDNSVFCRRSKKIQKIPKKFSNGNWVLDLKLYLQSCCVCDSFDVLSLPIPDPNCCKFCCCCCCCSCNARAVQDFQFMAEERVETGGTDLDRWIRRHRCGERVGGGRIWNRSWPLDSVAQRSGDLEIGKWVGWLVVAALCTNLDRWILRGGGGVREWDIVGGGRTLHRSRPLDSAAQRSPGGS